MSTMTETSSSSPVSNLLSQNVGGSTEDNSSSQSAEDSARAKLPEFYWMVRPCFVYKDDFKDCKSIRSRFHQYFIHGTTTDCTQWKEDYDNCSLWKKKQDVEALKKVIEGETSRLRHRLQSHYANNVWEHRTSPPSDWSKELPEPIKKSYEHTLLKKKADGLKSGKEKLDTLRGADPEMLEESCSIV